MTAPIDFADPPDPTRLAGGVLARSIFARLPSRWGSTHVPQVDVWAVVQLIEASGPMTTGGIALHCSIGESRVKSLLTRARKAGWLMRRKSQGRTVYECTPRALVMVKRGRA